MKSELIINIDGFEIKTNSIYKIVNKPDASAPSGLKALGTTKIPSTGVQETIGCRFDLQTKKWDHGFNEGCPCYRSMNKSEVHKVVDKLNEFIVDKYTTNYVSDEHPISTNSAEEFWSNYSVSIEDGKIFKTSDIKDLFDLYIAVRSHSLTPNNQKGSPKYSLSNYIIIDKNLAVEHKKSQNTLKIDAITEFGILLKTDKNKLLHILYYMGNAFSDDVANNDLKSIFATITENSENVEYFMNLVTDSESKKGEEKLFLYKKLKENFNRDNGVKKLPSGAFTFNDVEIGADLKSAAHRITVEEDFKSIKKEILLGSED